MSTSTPDANKATKLEAWANALKPNENVSELKLGYLYDLVRRDGVDDELRREVYTAMKYGATRKQVDFFIDVLLGKCDWTPPSKRDDNADSDSRTNTDMVPADRSGSEPNADDPYADFREPVGAGGLDLPDDDDDLPWI